MIPAEFKYFRPSSVTEAVAILQEQGDEAKLIAGGHSLLPAMKLRLASFGALVDISGLAELKGIDSNGKLTVGAGATYHDIATSDAVRSSCLVLAECAGQIGDIQVRNRGTIGGSLAHADPAADLTAVALALGAELTVIGPGGTKSVAIDDFFVDMLTTSIESGDVITRVTLPKLGAGEGAAYAKMRHPASRYAIVGVAAYVHMSGGKVASARIAVTGAGPKPVRQGAAEQSLIGTDGGADAIAAAAELSGSEMDFLGDIHASEEYRRAMVKVYTKRALAEAVQRAS